jgi:hypothetical protein
VPRLTSTALLALAVAGCGRVDFDPTARAADGAPATDVAIDSAPTHDEDGDGIPDAIDNCPVDPTATQEPDTDGDGIGDLCDPHPADNHDRVVLFATMQPGDTGGFDDSTGTPFTQDADAVETQDAAVTSRLTFPVALASARVEVGYDLLDLGVATAQQQLAIGAVPADDGDRNFVELNYIPGVSTYVGATWFDGSGSYERLDEHALAGAIPLGAFQLISTGDPATGTLTDDGRFAAGSAEYTGTGHAVFGSGLRAGTSLEVGIVALHVRVRYVWATTSP